MLENLPPGTSWEDSPLFDFSARPRLEIFTGLCRQLQMAWLALKYSGALTEEKSVSILDAACGFGEVYSIIQHQEIKGHVKYVGIDVDPRKRERALTLMPDIDFRLGLLQDVRTVVGGTHDVIISSESIERISKADGEQFMADCARLLAPDGTMIITCPNQRYTRDNEWHMYEWPDHELMRLVLDSGWSIVDNFYLSAPIGDIPVPEGIAGRMPEDMIRGVMSPDAIGKVTVLVLRR